MCHIHSVILLTPDFSFSFLSVWRTTYWTVLRFTDVMARTTLRQRVRDHPIWWNLDMGKGHEIAAWRMTHLPPRVYTNGDKRTIELYVVINRFGWFLLTLWSSNILGRSYIAICRGCTFIYTRTRCSMAWNIPGILCWNMPHTNEDLSKQETYIFVQAHLNVFPNDSFPVFCSYKYINSLKFRRNTRC